MFETITSGQRRAISLRAVDDIDARKAVSGGHHVQAEPGVRTEVIELRLQSAVLGQGRGTVLPRDLQLLVELLTRILDATAVLLPLGLLDLELIDLHAVKGGVSNQLTYEQAT